MERTDHIRLMATYNDWMNVKVYEAAGKLTDEALSEDRKAFFGSIIGTLNHLVVADTIWLKRFTQHPANHLALEPLRQLAAPTSLDQIVFSNIRELTAHRVWLDQLIIEWSRSLTETDLDYTLNYHSVKGVAAGKNFYALLVHFFNHQTHHRGQVTTLLSQVGIDVGDTDLLRLIASDFDT